MSGPDKWKCGAGCRAPWEQHVQGWDADGPYVACPGGAVASRQESPEARLVRDTCEAVAEYHTAWIAAGRPEEPQWLQDYLSSLQNALDDLSELEPT